MKKQLLFLACFAALCCAAEPVPATDVGKSPTKTEISGAVIESTCTVFTVQAYDATLATAEIAITTGIDHSTSFEKAVPVSPGVSMPKGDAAIPISAQARFNSNILSSGPLKEYIPKWDYNLNRYWC